MKKKIPAGVIAILTLSLFILSACEQNPPPDNKYTALAQCLTAKGVIFYGAFWCPHCQDQKKMFGEAAMKYINYVECDPQGENAKPEECQKAGVKSYPTWFFPGQGNSPGAMKPEDIAQKANCEDTLLPPASEQTTQQQQPSSPPPPPPWPGPTQQP